MALDPSSVSGKEQLPFTGGPSADWREIATRYRARGHSVSVQSVADPVGLVPIVQFFVSPLTAGH